jgi:ABC-2 type transport system ATP-binding protein
MIKVENLRKTFGSKLAVNDLSFEVHPGEVLGFLGPNGAGKSTTMRIVTGFIAPTAGRASVCGFDVVEQPIEAKRRIGYLPEAAPSYGEMTVEGFLGWAADMRGLTGQARMRAIGDAVDACSLASVLRQPIDTLSKGFRHRTCLAQAILHDPEVLILDEPTDGLDPNQKHEVRQLIRRMSEKKTIIFSTHILEEVEEACTRAIIIDGGSIVANGTPAELKARAVNAGAVLGRFAASIAERAQARLAGIPGVGRVEQVATAGDSVVLRAAPGGDDRGEVLAARVVAELALAGLAPLSIASEQGRLDDVFRAITHSDIHHARGGRA